MLISFFNKAKVSNYSLLNKPFNPMLSIFIAETRFNQEFASFSILSQRTCLIYPRDSREITIK
jgi:hypothetical protein